MAAAINELELPSFHIPDLFLPQKLGIILSPKQNNLTLAPLPTAIPTPPWAEDSNPYVHESGLDTLPFASVEPEMIIPKQHSPHSSYSSAVQAPPKRAGTPELDSGGSTVSTDESEESVALRRSPTISKSRLVNPNAVS